MPITLGTVLIAEGMLTYFGPKGWLSQFLQFFHLYEGPIRLTHNYWGVLISLVISGFPFAFLLILSYITGIDPVLARAAATLGADPRAQFRHIYLPLLAPGLAMCFCLAFVQAFSVFPSAVLLGSPAGPDARDLDRRVRGGVRAVRLLARVRDRDDHGLRAARHRRRRARAAQPVLPRAGERGQGMSCGTRSGLDRWRGARLLSGLMTLFVVNIGLMIAAVATNSFAQALARHVAARRLDHDVVHVGVEGVPARSILLRSPSRSCSRSCSWRS